MNLTLSLFPFGWQHYLLGGLLIGSAVALLFVFTGLIGGMSTVFSSTWSFVVQRPFFQQARFTDSRGWRLVYALGLILGALVWWLGFADGAPQTTSMFSSGSTFTTLRFCTVTCSTPMCPAPIFPLKILEGSEDEPMEPA